MTKKLLLMLLVCSVTSYFLNNSKRLSNCGEHVTIPKRYNSPAKLERLYNDFMTATEAADKNAAKQKAVREFKNESDLPPYLNDFVHE